MEYFSTRNTQKIFSFKDVFLKGLAEDGGLYVPKKIPSYTLQELKKFEKFSYEELAFQIIFRFCSDTFNESELKKIIKHSYKVFREKEVVTVRKFEGINLLELFNGPTLAFKDIAMQVIGNMYENILKKDKSKVNILVATSGDTGAAAVEAIKNRKDMKIFVLHPNNKISKIQRKFMTTGDANNVYNIALDGNFDDCQKIVKSLFADKKFNISINMSGVNSINWARIIVQIVYYFFCYFKVCSLGEKINFSVPTGNFGDIYAGYVAKKMGLPIDKLVIATNTNDILKRVVKTGHYRPLNVEHTISPSMDIQMASNFERLIFDIYKCSSSKTIELMNSLKSKGEFMIKEKELKKIRDNFLSDSLSEQETRRIISQTYNDHKILVDPHTAIGIGVAKKVSLKGHIVVLATAHPYKFSEVVSETIKIEPKLPKNLENIFGKIEKFDTLPVDLLKIKNYILERA